MADAGLTVLVPAICPLDEHRDMARKVHLDNGVEFFEIFVDTPIELCEERDPKGSTQRPGRVRSPISPASTVPTSGPRRRISV